jgi:hypothetical protein
MATLFFILRIFYAFYNKEVMDMKIYKFLYVLKACHFNWRRTKNVYGDLLYYDDMVNYPAMFDTFYDFVEKHKGVLNIEDVTILTFWKHDQPYTPNDTIDDQLCVLAFDKVLKEKRRYYLYLLDTFNYEVEEAL